MPQCPACMNNSCGHRPRDSLIPLIICIIPRHISWFTAKIILNFTHVSQRVCVWGGGHHETPLLQHVQQHILEGGEGGFAGRQAVFENSATALNLPVKSELQYVVAD